MAALLGEMESPSFSPLATEGVCRFHRFTVKYCRFSAQDLFRSLYLCAAEPSDDVVPDTLRHTAISEMIASGLDSFIVARLAGTRTAMIDAHYGHLRHDRTRTQLDAAVLL